MNLHKDRDLFKDLVTKSAHSLGTNPFYIEKDYYVVKMLKNIVTNGAKENISFKGGTSLSKAYGIIQRFSEDVDIRVHEGINPIGGGVAKRLYRKVEASIADDSLKNMQYINKGTSLREQRFSFEHCFSNPSEETLPYLKLEQNYQSAFLPCEDRAIESYVGKYVRENIANEMAIKYSLEPFLVPTLCPKITFAEKLGALEEYYYKGEVDSDFLKLVSSVRHFYDLHQMLNHPYFKEYLTGDELMTNVLSKRENDIQKYLPHKKDGTSNFYGYLQAKKLSDCPLFLNGIESTPCYKELQRSYQESFSTMVFGKLPSFSGVCNSFSSIREYFLKREQ